MSDDGFLGRWAKRKAAAREGVIDEPTPNTSTSAANEAKLPQSAGGTDTLAPTAASAEVSLPSIESLTRDSDYTPFMANSVSPEIRNRAVKKLFTDPHYNIMDGLDTYIDDYSNPEPLPAEWLAKLVEAALPAPVEGTVATVGEDDSATMKSSTAEGPTAAQDQLAAQKNVALQHSHVAPESAAESLDSAVQQPLK